MNAQKAYKFSAVASNCHDPGVGRDGVVADLGRSFGGRIKDGSMVDDRDSLRNHDVDFCDYSRDGQSYQGQCPGR
ncbi:MAG: hypothetical protein MK102_13880 [Fuerstiella sp.]|nr:hypothetical protein [Fuerstiella sp.]